MPGSRWAAASFSFSSFSIALASMCAAVLVSVEGAMRTRVQGRSPSLSVVVRQRGSCSVSRRSCITGAAVVARALLTYGRGVRRESVVSSIHEHECVMVLAVQSQTSSYSAYERSQAPASALSALIGYCNTPRPPASGSDHMHFAWVKSRARGL